MKPKIKYDEEELGILEAWETGTLKLVKDSEQEIKKHKTVALETFKKTNTSIFASPVKIPLLNG